MPVKIFHNRYLFIRMPEKEENYRNIYKLVIDGFSKLYGYVSLGHARIKVVEFYSKKGVLILRVDSRFHNHLITAIKYVSIKNDLGLEVMGSSQTLRQGRKRFIG